MVCIISVPLGNVHRVQIKCLGIRATHRSVCGWASEWSESSTVECPGVLSTQIHQRRSENQGPTLVIH